MHVEIKMTEEAYGRVGPIRDDGTVYVEIEMEGSTWEGEMTVKQMEEYGLEDGQLFDWDGKTIVPRPIIELTTEEITEFQREIDEVFEQFEL